MSRSVWGIWRMSCPRRWASVLTWAGSMCPCFSRRGKISICVSSKISGAMPQGTLPLECQGVYARPCLRRHAVRCDWSAMRPCGKGFASITAFGPKVSRRCSLVCANIDIIDATPPTSALLKLNASKFVHRTVVNLIVTLRGSRCEFFSSFWAMGMARPYNDFHISLTSVLRLRCH